MSMLDFFTGGKSGQAEEALTQAQQYLSGVDTPTQEQLSLPELQQYVNAGLMTPAQMQAYVQENNALSTENTPQTGTDAQIAAINQLAGVANAGAAGTPVEQAQQAQAIQAMNQATAGQRGAIEQEAEARGTPGALYQAATANQTAGQEAQQGYQNSLQSQAQAYQAAINAMSQGANAGQALQGQENAQSNTVAQAQNAMQQFNAANQQTASGANANMRQQANAYNSENAQNVANANTQTRNQRTMYNAQVPEQVFQNKFQKATGQAGVSQNQSNLYTGQGKQNLQMAGGLINFFSPTIGSGVSGAGGGSSAGRSGASMPNLGSTGAAGTDASAGMYSGLFAKGGIIPSHDYCYHEGGICMEGGGMVPGKPKVQGDSLRNDTVTARVSPGEAVIPRTAVQQHTPEVLSLIAGSKPTIHHPHDVAALLEAMKSLRGAA